MPGQYFSQDVGDESADIETPGSSARRGVTPTDQIMRLFCVLAGIIRKLSFISFHRWKVCKAAALRRQPIKLN